MRKNYKIKRRKMNFKNIFILLIIILTFSFLRTAVLAKDFKNTVSYIVESNDTLWSIAKDVCSTSKKNINIQKTVCEIKKMNNMTSSNIFEGQELILPIY